METKQVILALLSIVFVSFNGYAVDNAVSYGVTAGSCSFGTNAVLNITSANASGFTFEAWIYRKDILTTNQAIYSRAVVSGADGYEVWINTNKLQLDVLNSGQSRAYTIASTVNIASGVWTNVVCEINSSTASIFVNGKFRNGTEAVGQTKGFGGSISIGAYIGNAVWDPAEPANIIVDEVRISNNLRYTAEFSVPTAAYTSDGSTRVLWHFDEGSGTSTVDSSGNSVTGSLSGTYSWVNGVFYSATVAEARKKPTRVIIY
jgi:hypothetical protein